MIEELNVEELEGMVKGANLKAFDNPEIDRIIWTYKKKLSTGVIADYINKTYGKSLTPSQIRHRFDRLKRLHSEQ